ncbi:hypothetical protein CONCODRAFT_13952 [Conidiobolus coronatus NRRL 28638]|uniref:Uncharacterized protein n=1 Tax=Conidiobolus coronatus (strain ATCC 28846 / CBS 209.66 / NRRL 28638) TaxID=796925 RepID=A0A137NPU7_CONC2|nr:hypothetical protein CONCODRAFT_13952 [Conidiobolus coronatus NRRL 28638]|eukprot:KXN64773.1 hypothetical protein CONCODRAFT_13952 [Conidiobolus coronatus NRRL 28638]
MKLTNLIHTFICLATGLQVTQGAQVMDKDTSVCTNPCTRKEVRELTPEEFINFIDAFKKLQMATPTLPQYFYLIID